MAKITVALDCMGGDYAPTEPVLGAIKALGEEQELSLILVGDEPQIREILSLNNGDQYNDRIQVVHTTEVIETAEHPVQAISKKKDSSLVVAMKQVKEKNADAFVSAGNSGAILVGGQVLVGRLKGVKRSPLAPVIPTEKGGSILIDCGANVDSKPENLVQYAHFGSLYMEKILGKENPTVAIVNVGAEEEKGNALVKETFPLLKAESGINFIGSIEARDIPSGYADVIVCDAFVGNVILKMYEGVAKMFLHTLKTGLTSSTRSKIGAALAMPALKKELKTFDTSQYGGAPMLGLNGLVVKAHGNSKAKEISIAIRQCITFKEQNLDQMILEYLENANK